MELLEDTLSKDFPALQQEIETIQKERKQFDEDVELEIEALSKNVKSNIK